MGLCGFLSFGQIEGGGFGGFDEGKDGRTDPHVASLLAMTARWRGIVFYYKPIDIVGNMCYHPITYKKDMLKE